MTPKQQSQKHYDQKAVNTLLEAIRQFNQDYQDPVTWAPHWDPDDILAELTDQSQIIKLINEQRDLNKILSMLSQHFSHHRLYMAVADTARREAISFGLKGGDTYLIWQRRYWDIREHSELRYSRDAWQRRYLRAKSAMQRLLQFDGALQSVTEKAA